MTEPWSRVTAYPDNKRLATIAQAAAYVGVNPKTIRRRIEDGYLAMYRLGSRFVRVDLNHVDAVYPDLVSSLPREARERLIDYIWYLDSGKRLARYNVAAFHWSCSIKTIRRLRESGRVTVYALPIIDLNEMDALLELVVNRRGRRPVI